MNRTSKNGQQTKCPLCRKIIYIGGVTMSKQKLKDNEKIIIAMREAGKSRQEIADELGLTKSQIKSWVTRYNRKNEKQARGIPTLPTGRPRKDYELTDENRLEYYKRQVRLAKSENKRLKMENDLMRDFLSLTGKE